MEELNYYNRIIRIHCIIPIIQLSCPHQNHASSFAPTSPHDPLPTHNRPKDPMPNHSAVCKNMVPLDYYCNFSDRVTI